MVQIIECFPLQDFVCFLKKFFQIFHIPSNSNWVKKTEWLTYFQVNGWRGFFLLRFILISSVGAWVPTSHTKIGGGWRRQCDYSHRWITALTLCVDCGIWFSSGGSNWLDKFNDFLCAFVLGISRPKKFVKKTYKSYLKSFEMPKGMTY